MILRGKQAMLDRKLPHRDLQNLEVGYLLHRWRRFVIVAAAGMFVCRLHVPSLLNLVRLPRKFKWVRASDPGTRSATYRSRMGTPPKDRSDGTARCNIVRAGHRD